MAGKHKGWYKKWTLDVDGETAVHESGFAVRYNAGVPNVSMDESVIRIWASQQEARGVRGDDALAKRIARLLREAEDLWTWCAPIK